MNLAYQDTSVVYLACIVTFMYFIRRQSVVCKATVAQPEVLSLLSCQLKMSELTTARTEIDATAAKAYVCQRLLSLISCQSVLTWYIWANVTVTT